MLLQYCRVTRRRKKRTAILPRPISWTKSCLEGLLLSAGAETRAGESKKREESEAGHGGGGSRWKQRTRPQPMTRRSQCLVGACRTKTAMASSGSWASVRLCELRRTAQVPFEVRLPSLPPSPISQPSSVSHLPSITPVLRLVYSTLSQNPVCDRVLTSHSRAGSTTPHTTFHHEAPRLLLLRHPHCQCRDLRNPSRAIYPWHRRRDSLCCDTIE